MVLFSFFIGARDILHTWYQVHFLYRVCSILNLIVQGHLRSFGVIFRMFATKHRIWQSHRGHYLKSLQRLEVKGQMTSRENSRRFKSDLIPYLEIKRLPPSFDISITSQNQNENEKGMRDTIILIGDPYTRGGGLKGRLRNGLSRKGLLRNVNYKIVHFLSSCDAQSVFLSIFSRWKTQNGPFLSSD